MHADSHFVIGQAHVTGGKPCQDYATSGELSDDGAFAVVSDGCSSGGNTDVGARILALATASAIRQPWMNHRVSDARLMPVAITLQQQAVMAGTSVLLDCAADDLLATAVYAVVTPAHRFAFIHGDGVVAWEDGEGALWMTQFEWDDNTPYYPAYENGRNTEFVACHGGDITAERLNYATWVHSPDGTITLNSQGKIRLAAGMRGVLWPLEAFEDMRRLAVFTDGVSQIGAISWQDAVAQLLDFKSTTGAFVKRRLNRFVKDSRNAGRGPIDDLAYAVIDLAIKEVS